MASDRTYTIVCLSTQLWEDPMWTNKQHVMSRLAAQGHTILYVDPLIRTRKFVKHIFWGRYSLKRLLTWEKQISETMWLYSPVKMFFSEALETRFLLSQINRLIKKHNLSNPLLWVYDPEFSDYVDEIDHSLLIYDCVDDYANFPPQRYPKGRDWIIEKERRLIKEADAVFATAHHLYETRTSINPNTFYTPNVADYEHNSKALDESTEIPEELKNLQKPIIGFQGALASYKINIDLLQRLAEEHPNWSLVLVGPKAPVDPDTDLSSLQSLPNVFFAGIQPYELLPNFYKAFDVALIPSVLNEYTRSSFPLKFFEYLGAGLPVVATKLPSLIDYYDTGVAYFAESDTEFIKMVEQAVATGKGPGQEKRRDVAKTQSWDGKVKRLLEIINVRLSEQSLQN